MREGALSSVVHHVRRLSPSAEPRTDRELLVAFVAEQDQDAFAELLARHGAMVLAVCRRLTGHAQEAEDAFQATWLVLARKAGSVRWTDTIAAWLHAVACRVAAKARGQAARCQQALRALPMHRAMPEPEPSDDLPQRLHAELARLPEKWRAPLVLCYLEGQTHQQAAAALGCPVGSMSKRLDRARELLRQRLGAGGAAGGPICIEALLGQTAPAALTSSLTHSTLHAAALVAAGQTATGAVTAAALSLAEGALREMSTQNLRLAMLAALTTVAFATGIGALALSDYSDKSAPDQPVAAAKDAAARAAPEPVARARTFKSALPLAVYQLVPGEHPRLLGLTGPGNTKAVQVPAGAVWYIQPLAGGFGLGGGGINLGVGGGFAGAVGGQLGQLGNIGGAGVGGGQLGVGGGAVGFAGGQLGRFVGGKGGGGMRGKPPVKGKPPFQWGPKLGAEQVKALVAEIKKQNVPGLGLAAMPADEGAVAALAKGVPGLQVLVCEGTTIDDKGAAKLTGFAKLRCLRLVETAVTAEGLGALKDLKALSRLELVGDKFNDKAAEAVAAIQSLTAVQLSRTEIEGSGLKALKSLRALTTLELCGPFTDTDLKELKALPQLKALRLHQTSVTDDGLAELKALKKLDLLALDAHWDLHGIQPAIAGGIGLGGGGAQMKWFPPKQVVHKGRVVALPAPQWTGKGLAALAKLDRLTELHVSNDQLRDEDLATVARFAGLKRLTVFAPEVGDAGIGKLKGMKKVEALDLRGTAMTTGAATTLRALPALRSLRTNVLPMDPKFKAKLTEWKRALPRVAVQAAFPQLPSGVGMGGGFGG